MDEFARIAEIERRLRSTGADPRVELGIGDDAAVLAKSPGRLVLSVDAQVEGTHFRFDWASAGDIGFRSFVAALSDLAAMGASPRAGLCALIAPASLDEDVLFSIADGVGEASALYDAPVVGGNLAMGAQLSLTFTVVGECEGAPLVRSAARAGDNLFVTGTLGSAALGVAALGAGRPELAPRSVERWRRPRARIREGRALLGVASAAIDLSDGLVQDLEHVCRASRVGAVIELECLPLDAELLEVATLFDRDPIELALSGGEDYELLFSAPSSELPDATRIGRIVEGSGIQLQDASGALRAAPARGGFRHF